MKRSGNITLLCGAAAVILSSVIMLYLLKNETVMQITTGTYGSHIYRYGFDTGSLEFSLLEKIEAENASYAIKDAAMSKISYRSLLKSTKSLWISKPSSLVIPDFSVLGSAM